MKTSLDNVKYRQGVINIILDRLTPLQDIVKNYSTNITNNYNISQINTQKNENNLNLINTNISNNKENIDNDIDQINENKNLINELIFKKSNYSINNYIFKVDKHNIIDKIIE